MKYINNSNRYIKVIITFYLFVFSYYHQVAAQSRLVGSPIVAYFGTDDYRAGIQNYAITQDYRGLIYVANNLGLLEYDGTSWTKYNIDKGTKVRSLYADPNGRIYVGAQNEIGYFFPDSDGSYKYHSLNELIPEELSNFNDIWKIHPQTNGCVFASSSELFQFNGHSIKVIPINQPQNFTFGLDGEIITQTEGSGLVTLVDNEWNKLPYGDFFSGKQVSGITRFNKENILISTYEHGLFLAGNEKVTKWATNYAATFSTSKINTIFRLKNGSIAIGTNFDGMYILNQMGELIYHFKKGENLQNKTVLAIYEDSFGNIWLGLNNGIAKIEWQSPFSIIDKNIGLVGTGYCAYSNNDYIYMGTNNGLYFNNRNKAISEEEIKKVEGIEGQIYSIQNISGSILVGGHWGAFELKDNVAVKISGDIGWWTFVETRNRNLAIGGNYNGLYLLQRINNSWTVIKKYKGFSESSRVMLFDNDGTLWMTHGYKGVYSFRFTDDFSEIEEEKYYNEKDGFPSRLLINVFKVNKEIIFAAENGIYLFDRNVNRFVPHIELNELLGQEHIREIEEDSFGNIYFIGTNKSGVLTKNDWSGYQLETHLFNKIHSFLNDDLENISILDNANLMFASKEGFYLFNKDVHYNPDFQFNLLVREVRLTKNDSLLFGGNFNDNEKVLLSQQENDRPVVAFKNNSISFSYSAIEYNQRNALYRYRLSGFDENWSIWTNKTNKEYTNLHEGKYVFQVEARDVYNNLSGVQSYKFTILAPWYRTYFAYFLYIIWFLLSIIISVFYSKRKHHNEKRRLIINQKRELNNRDNILNEVSRRSEEEINRLKNEKLKAEIKHKNKELATNTMHIIDKNEFIKSIKGRLNEIVANEGAKTNQKLRKIVSEIEKNMKDDDNWKQFEYHFDEVHGDFFKKLREENPNITPQELKLSAYLRMNMSTKEIANLLRISVRGVEIARYRLRKKLQLDKNINLVDYIMKY